MALSRHDPKGADSGGHGVTGRAAVVVFALDRPTFADVTESADRTSLTVAGAEVGLGDDVVTHIELSVTMLCVRGDSTQRTLLVAAGDFPVRAGVARFTLVAAAPSCGQDKATVFHDATLADPAHDVREIVGHAYEGYP